VQDSDKFKIAAAAALGAAGALILSRVLGGQHKLQPQQVAEALGMIPHPEGGYFLETFRSGSTPMASKGKTDAQGVVMDTDRSQGGKRNVMTSIYYMLTAESPRQWWANNMSDHVHYWHGGSSITYHVIHPDGKYEKVTLGPNVTTGEKPQLVVKGGSFKCAHLEAGDYGLLGEGVAPGFDFHDFQFVSAEDLKTLAPGQYEALKGFVKDLPDSEFDSYYTKHKK